MTPAAPARIHLLPAPKAPYVIVLRRKPSKVFHVLRWDTRSDRMEHGSWFRGKLYPMRCDVSFDGRWMVYLAMGANGSTWNGICELPWLKTFAEGENEGTWFGGGYWRDAHTLLCNGWKPTVNTTAFACEPNQPSYGGEDLSVLYPRLRRDGFRRIGDNFGEDRPRPKPRKYIVDRIGDDGWSHQPTRRHPTLRLRYIGYLEHGYTFAFDLDRHPTLLDRVDWANWDSLGNLVFARQGVLYRYTLSDLQHTPPTPSATIDLEPLAPPLPPST